MGYSPWGCKESDTPEAEPTLALPGQGKLFFCLSWVHDWV